MGNHLPADLGEPRQPIGNSNKTLLIESRDVPGDVPAIEKSLAGEIFPAEVALHDIRAANEQHARLADFQLRVEIIGIDHLDGDPWKGLPHGALPGAGLVEAGGAEITRIDRHHGGALSGPVALERANPEVVLEGVRHPVRELLSPGDHETQRAELGCGTPPEVELQEGGRRQEHADPVLLHLLADQLRVHRVGKGDTADGFIGGEPEDHVAEGMKVRQDPEQPVLIPGTDDLRNPLQVRGHVEMTQEHTLGFAGRAARKNHGDDVVYRNLLTPGTDSLDQSDRDKERQQHRLELAAKAYRFAKVINPDRLDIAGQLHLGLLQEHPAGHHGFQAGLANRRFKPIFSRRVVQIHTRLR